MAKKVLVDEVMGSAKEVTLYHVSPYADRIIAEGFKPRRETGLSGLGGADVGNYISFTTSPVIARDIARDMQTVAAIKSGAVDFDGMGEFLDKMDYDGEPYYKVAMTERPSRIWKDNISSHRSEVEGLEGEHKKTRLFEMFNLYMYQREEHGGRKNPLFFFLGDSPLDKSDINIGVVKTTVTLPKIKTNASKNPWEKDMVEVDPTLPNLFEDFERAYDEYRPNYGDDQKPYRTPKFRTGDNFLREVKLDVSLIPCKKNGGKTCQNFSKFDISAVTKEDYERKAEEADELKYHRVKGDFERFVCSKISEGVTKRYDERKEGWYWGLSNIDEKYPIHVEYVLRDKPHLDEVLPEIEKECADRYPKGVCKRLFADFFAKEKKCQGW